MTRKLLLEYEGSWAFMLEEITVKALKKYHGRMAKLNTTYYLSIQNNRYYKVYLDQKDVDNNRRRMLDFLSDDSLVINCLEEIDTILDNMRSIKEKYLECDKLIQKYDLYCNYCLEYLGYYNSALSDTFYQNVYKKVDSFLQKLPQQKKLAVKDALYSTNNIDLKTHRQLEEWLKLYEKNTNHQLLTKDLQKYTNEFRSIFSSSLNPDGLSINEIRESLSSTSEEEYDKAVATLKNLDIRYENAISWGEKTADFVNLNDILKTILKNTRIMSYVKIKMRECFQQFKQETKDEFLNELIQKLGKNVFDYMSIDEIRNYIINNELPDFETIEKRRLNIIIEMENDTISFLNKIPNGVVIKSEMGNTSLNGEVLIGEGLHTYKVVKIEQDIEGLQQLESLINSKSEKENLAIVTNTLRPFLVPKLKGFGALLTQHGGFTSHAAVLCRELGINSIIGITDLMKSLQTNDVISINYYNGEIVKQDIFQETKATRESKLFYNLNAGVLTPDLVGKKATNLTIINQYVNIAKGFVLSNEFLTNLEREDYQQLLFERISELNVEKIVIRSSHENEDSTEFSFAGLFNSFVDIDVGDKDKIINCIKKVCESTQSDSIKKYKDNLLGNMFVIIQEMISADISGVILTSKPSNGIDYMLIEYLYGDLHYLMNGDITPFTTYVNKLDAYNNNIINTSFLPPLIETGKTNMFKQLINDVMKLEKHFGYSLEIEWCFKNNRVIIFQARPNKG